jgi:hypothetical protein
MLGLMQDSNHSGVMSNVAIFNGDNSASEIDLELQGQPSKWDQISKNAGNLRSSS